MADTQKPTSATSGFSLPAPVTDSGGSASTVPVTVIVPPGETLSGTYTVVSETPPRDMLIGGAVLLLLLVAFFFAKNAYANSLVAKRVSPNGANAAGWWMFILLGAVATAAVLMAVNSARFISPFILGPLALVAVLALVLMLTSGRK